MKDRPQHLVYALDERPPNRTLAVMALQHMVLALMLMLYPVILAAEIGLDEAATRGLLTTTVLAAGIGSILQASRMGSGFLAVNIPSPILMPGFIAAARTHGLGAACGTLAVCALVEMGLARLLPRLRSYFPPEVCGVAVMMLGISLIKGGLMRITGFDAATQSVAGDAIAVGLFTLGSIIALSVWSRGPARLFAMLVGCAAGYAAAAALGLLGPDLSTRIAAAPLLDLPVPAVPPLRFSLEAFLPLMIAVLLSMMDTVGCVITLDKMNKAHWARTEMSTVSRGVMAEGMTNVLSAAGGSFGINISSANIGLSFASGVTSRIVGTAAGVLLIVAAFVPKLLTLLIYMPPPVIGAVLVFTAACLITAGMELIVSRLINQRRLLVIGLSVVLGLSVTTLPGLYDGLPGWLAPVFHSELSTAAVAALLLNLVLRIGVGRTAELAYDPQEAPLTQVYQFLEAQGAAWGARRDVMQRATIGAVEALQALTAAGTRGPIRIEASFDELNLDLRLRHAGAPLALAAGAVDWAEVLDSDDDAAVDAAMRAVSSTLVAKLADRVAASARGDEALLLLHFDH